MITFAYKKLPKILNYLTHTCQIFYILSSRSFIFFFRASGKTEVTVTREGDFIPNSPDVVEEINIFQG